MCVCYLHIPALKFPLQLHFLALKLMGELRESGFGSFLICGRSEMDPST